MLNFKRTFMLTVFLLLTGCSIPQDSFDCKYSKGVGCCSITEVNGMVNQGRLGKKPFNDDTPLKDSVVLISPDSISADSMVIKRITEEHLRIWLAPYQDKQGHFHEASIIHTVLKPGCWQVAEEGA